MVVTLHPKTNTEIIMSKTRRLLLLAVLLIGICCGVSAKTLVAYYSFTNNVRTIVNELATQKEVDVGEIQPTEEGLDYAANNYALGTQLLNAIKADPNDADSYPAIKAVSVDLSQYNDIIMATSQVTPVDVKKMVVLSDPHVMAPELLVNMGTAWTTYLDGQRKLVDYSKRLFDDMIVRIKRDLRPGLVLISGDLTKDGEQVSHEYVTSKLDELRAIGIKTLVIPGNHDRGSNSDAVYYDGESTTPATVATNEWFATQYANSIPLT